MEPATGRVHEFCCRTHAKIAMNHRGEHPIPVKAQRNNRVDPRGDRRGECSLPGCTYKCFVDPSTGETMDYCGRTHAFKVLLTYFFLHHSCAMHVYAAFLHSSCLATTRRPPRNSIP